MSDASSPHANCPPGSRYPLLPGVRSRVVETPRLRQHVYESGPEGAPPLLLSHGNASSARFFEELMATLPEYHIVAPDHRGYGASEAKRADATRGLRDYSDDLEALVQALGWGRFHLLGWSLGGNIAMQYAIDHPQRIQTLTLHATGSPYGYGGTHGADGAINYDDFAGSGGGLIGQPVVERYLAKDFTADSPFAPRNGLRQLIVKPTFTLAPDLEDRLVEQMLLMVIGDEFYPGDKVSSPNWPFSGPGLWGSNNALSPKYGSLAAFADIAPKPPVLWARGADDRLVSDTAAADPAALGKLGVIPGWPGDEVCPPQPMIRQIRAVLDRYRANGGTYEEVVFEDCGHAPLIEKAGEFRALLRQFLEARPLPAETPAVPATPSVEGRNAAETAMPAASMQPGPAAGAAGTQSRRGLFGLFRRRDK